MRCCVPSCENASGNLCKPKRDSITFHEFPREVHHRSAWVRSLGQQDSQLPDSAVVCSQHFLPDDICETESGSRELRTDAVPATVLVCMICFDTDSKMLLTSQYNLREAYEKLTGYPLCDGGNLKQTLCVQCAQRLRNFSRFRDKSLRARSLMMKLLEKNKLVTMDHIKKTQRENTQLKNNLVSTMLGPDHCDLYIFENTYDGSIPKSEETTDVIAVKTEFNSDSEIPSEDEATEMLIQDYNDTDLTCAEVFEDPLKYESSPYVCTVCCEEFPDEHAYSAHASMHLHGDAHPAAPSADTVVAPLPARLETHIENNEHATDKDYISVIQKQKLTNDSGPVLSNKPSHRDNKTNINIAKNTNCPDRFRGHLKRSDKYDKTFNKEGTRTQFASTSDGLNIKTDTNSQYFISYVRKNKTKVSKTAHGQINCSNDDIHEQLNSSPENTLAIDKTRYLCDVCGATFIQKSLLVKHIMTHANAKTFTCEICQYNCHCKSSFVRHVRSHSVKKFYACELCEYKSTYKSHFEAHVRRHTDVKSYACTICEFKCAFKRNLRDHMSTHTGEKPFACTLCQFKTKTRYSLSNHIKTHTGERPFACTLCEYKSVTRGDLRNHIKTHTGDKPFACKFCNYKCSRNRNLVIHTRTHTGEKPFACNLCEYKCTNQSSLVTHMRTHIGKKLYACELCEYKASHKDHLVVHMRTHTGEKPFYM